MDFGLQGVHVLVTGASGGIGIATAKLFLENGANVTAHYNSTSHTLDPLINEFGSSRIQRVQANLGVEEDVIRLFRSFGGHHFGPVQVAIVNHAQAFVDYVPVSRITLDNWNYTMNTNLTSSFLVVREFLKGLESADEKSKDKAAIVFIGSTAGKYGEAGNADYAATKSALMYGLTLSLKNEIVKIAPKGRVNCVAPGWVRTPMAAHALQDPSIVYQALATTPLKKIASPEEIASQIVVLASPRLSSHVTGQVLMVEGGMEGRLLNKPEDVNLT